MPRGLLAIVLVLCLVRIEHLALQASARDSSGRWNHEQAETFLFEPRDLAPSFPISHSLQRFSSFAGPHLLVKMHFQ